MSPLRRVHVHLVGCNGVPSSCYTPLLQRLEQRAGGEGARQRFAVASTSFSDVHGEAGETWDGAIEKIVADTTHVRERLSPDVPIVGFGHSMGGALVYAAATRCVAAAPASVGGGVGVGGGGVGGGRGGGGVGRARGAALAGLPCWARAAARAGARVAAARGASRREAHPLTQLRRSCRGAC